jgi:hypothetical protein
MVTGNVAALELVKKLIGQVRSFEKILLDLLLQNQ